ncbi:MAG: hypothetical protein EGR15_04780 [Lachnospiraceae bacterium]|nr:hypothetical protein [Lachnospiraceae bacterium]
MQKDGVEDRTLGVSEDRGMALKFQSKMRLVYIVLGIMTSFILGYLYYSISMDKIYRYEMNSLTVSAEQLKNQYDEMIETMKDVSYYLLSDPDILDAITSISLMKRSIDTETYFEDAERAILEGQSSDYLQNRFYRIIFCNANCKPIGNNGIHFQNQVSYLQMPWYEKAENSEDTFTIVGFHQDLWDSEEECQVFSVVKQIQGRNMGYIEVQQSTDRVEEKLRVADENLKVVILDRDGELLYQNTEIDTAFARKAQRQKVAEADQFHGSDGIKYLAAGISDETSGNFVLVYKESALMRKDQSHIIYTTILLSGMMLLFSIIYISVSTRKLTDSLIQLQNLLKNTSLETLHRSESTEITEGNDEFQRIARIYEDMRERLLGAIDREKKMQTLQLQAQLDMLQAQVNPHFIYNTLNVISSRGILDDDEVICDICDDLAGMLRYSTDTEKKTATIRMELEYLRKYFSLMKYRYEYKLEYAIEMDPEIDEQWIPKLTVQQFVENSIKYGYENTSKVMRITVKAYRSGDHWYIRIQDNGEGFSAEMLGQLENEMGKLKQELQENNRNVEMKIGGMGILNTYARLYLLSEKEMNFQISNRKEGGAEILFGSVLEEKRD